MTTLFSPITLRGVTFKNRIGVAPMGMCSAEDGFASEFDLVHIGSLATGGVGMVMLGVTAVEPRGRVTPNCLGIWKDEQVANLSRIAKFIKSQDAVPAIQLGHSGRKGSCDLPWLSRSSIAEKDGGWPTIGPSPIAFGDGYSKVPKEATLEDIEEIEEAFVTAAKRADKAGFKLIELHFAHGYLVSSFLSPVSNKRTDKYGGTLENRMRLALEIVKKVRKAIPYQTVLAVRISVSDYATNGWDMDQTLVLSKRVKELGVDLFDCSSGAMNSEVKLNPLVTKFTQINAARKVQQDVGIPTCAVGMITDPLNAEEILSTNGATFVLLGRILLNNPHWAFHAADLLANERSFKYPNPYSWCIGWTAFAKWRRLLSENAQQ